MHGAATKMIIATSRLLVNCIIVTIIRPHRLHAVPRCGLLLQILHLYTRLCAGHTSKLYEHNRYVVCIIWGSRSPHENGGGHMPVCCIVPSDDCLHSPAAGATHCSPAKGYVWCKFGTLYVCDGDPRCSLLPNYFGHLLLMLTVCLLLEYIYTYFIE